MKGACNKADWKNWPHLIDEAMKATVETYGQPDVIHAKARRGGRRARLYDTLQVTPNGCTCRVSFGADRHHKLQASSSETQATRAMGKMLMAKFKRPTQQWAVNQPGYHAKAFHLVLNRYDRNDGADPHKDLSETYDGRIPSLRCPTAAVPS